MYFNGNKSNTSIDGEFQNNNNILSRILNIFNKYKLFILISIIVIILIILMIIMFTNRKIEYHLNLLGENNITLYQGSNYIEPGYKAYNSKDEDLTNKVIIKSSLDINNPGDYVIEYKIGDITKTRTITVIAKTEEYTYIYLKSVDNDINVYLKLNEKYIEPGYQAFNTSGEDLTNKVKVSGEVNTSKRGSYKLVYTIVDSNDVTISAERIITVMDPEIKLTLSPNSYTNKDVTIKVSVADNYFDHMKLPDGTETTKSTYEYKVNKNGTYKFTTYNKKGMIKEESIEVKIIDRDVPKVSCNGSYKNGKSTINVIGNDNVGISKYVINGTEYNSNEKKLTKTITGELNTVSIKIYDKAGNSNQTSCKLEDKNGQGNQNVQIKSGRYSYYYHVKNKTVLTTLTEKWYFDNSGVILEMGFVIDIPDISLIKDLKKIPLIVKLHGGGGWSNESLLKSFIPGTRLGQENIPAIVLYPCKTTSTDVAWKKYNDAVIGIIDWVIKEYNIDENKISLAGFSRGGGGAWQIAAMNPDKFSGLVLIEPSMNGGKTKDWFDNTTLSYPVWIFHGKSDQLGLRGTTNRIYNQGCSANTKKKLTIDSKLVHSQVSLNILMDEYNLIDWMLERDRTKDVNFKFQ